MSKTLIAFNKYFYEFLKEVKSNCKTAENSTLYKELKTRYTVRDNETKDHINAFIASCNEDIMAHILSDVKDLDSISGLVLLDNYTVSDLREYCEDYVYRYILIFTYLCIVYQKHMNHEDLLIHCLSECQNHNKVSDDVVDDDLQSILKQISEDSCVNEEDGDAETNEDNVEPGSFEDMLGKTSIGSLAKEIASSIKVDDIGNIDRPEDLFKGENSKIIGDIVSKVTSNISAKMTDGTLNQDKLMSEAMSLMGNMGSNPMMQNLMKMMGGAGIHNNARARDRLAKKFAQRNQKKSSS